MPPERTIAWKAIGIGLAVYYGLATLLGQFLALFHRPHLPDFEQGFLEGIRSIFRNPDLLRAGLIMGLCTAVVAAAVTGRLASKRPFLHALVLWLLMVALSLPVWFMYPLRYNLISTASGIPATLLGALVGVTVFRKRRAKPPPLPPPAG